MLYLDQEEAFLLGKCCVPVLNVTIIKEVSHVGKQNEFSKKPKRPTHFDLKEAGKNFPPNYLHHTWNDFY